VLESRRRVMNPETIERTTVRLQRIIISHPYHYSIRSKRLYVSDFQPYWGESGINYTTLRVIIRVYERT
jgi:hypothetical protein